MRTIRIGGHVYTLEVRASADGDCGEIDYVTSTIVVNRDMQFSMQVSTLLHEAMHAMNPTLADEHLAHAFLDSLAEQLYQFLSENGLLDRERLVELLSAQPGTR